MAINSFPPSGDGPIQIPDQLIDPVSKFRVSNPENLIDTDFEYGLQPTKWETVELINNTPSFFSKSGDTTIDGISSIITNAGTREIIVKTELDHGLAVGIPINVTGTKSITADGAYIINSIPDTKTFTYLCKDNQTDTNSILDLYSSIITGEFFQGSQLRISDSDGIVTDAEGTSILTVTTNTTHGFGENTPFYFLNLNSTVAQEFQAANTASKSFDASNSATAQTFDGSNSLSSVNIDWSNSATFGGTPSTISGTDQAADTITVTHQAGENFNNLPLGTPLYYSVSATGGYFNTNPRGVVFLKTIDQLGTSTSTFKVSLVPDGDATDLTSNLSGTFQIANQARTFAGNNIDPLTQTVINVEVGPTFNFDGGNQGYTGAVQETNAPNNTLTVDSYDGTLINAEGSSASDHYVGSMVLYTSTGSAATGLTANTTYFITSFTNNSGGSYTFSVANLPGGTPISIPAGSGSGTQAFSKIGVSVDKDIVHIPNSNFLKDDMIEYTFPTDGRFGVVEEEQEKIFYFVDTVYDSHNYELSEDLGFKPVVATGGTILPDIISQGRTWRVHQFTSVGTSNFIVSDAGKEGLVEYLVVAGGGAGGLDNAGGGGAGGVLTGTTTVSVQSYPVVVGAGGTMNALYNYRGNPGQNSSALGFTAIGGGGGGGGDAGGSQSGATFANSQLFGGAGGSGGGGASESGNGTGGAGTPGQGNNGGNGNLGAGGGGGGALSAGTTATAANAPGNGGNGRLVSITGTSTYYGGGGGGGTENDNIVVGGAGLGGNGGGGQGGRLGFAPSPGTPNTGGGGGGDACCFNTAGGGPGSGGSGIVVIRYPITPEPEDFIAPTATGGATTSIVEGGVTYRLHTFTSVGTTNFVVQNPGNWGNSYEYLLIAGGGSGGIDVGGGGGGGGFRTGFFNITQPTTIPITVGAGGLSGSQRGGNSTIGLPTPIVSQGGGAGATWDGNRGGDGGSGGGGAGGSGAVQGGGTGTTGQGFNGSAGAPNQALEGGGGGGAGGPGGISTNGQGGAGGPGRPSTITGTTIFYSGGGGGGSDSTPGTGGIGGGANGSLRISSAAPSAAANTGGGGGGNGCCGPSGAGGSGIVIIKYPISQT
jgi:hypothetical protein